MSDRYTDREAAIVTYLQTQLGATYFVTREPSRAQYPPGKRIVMVRWLGFSNDTERNTSEPVSDTLRFGVRVVPGLSTDSAADESANAAAEAVVKLFRTRSSYSVLGDADGKPCGWRVLSASKGYVRDVGLVIDVELEVLVEEDY